MRGAEQVQEKEDQMICRRQSSGRSMAFTQQVAGVLLLVLSGLALAAETTTWGPAVGSTVEISASDQSGRMQTVATLSGTNGLLIFFNRSADW